VRTRVDAIGKIRNEIRIFLMEEPEDILGLLRRCLSGTGEE
jgi:hypothetical protein